MKRICKRNIAMLTSSIVNPFLVSAGLVLSIALTVTSSTAEGVKWFLISVAISILPVFILVLFLFKYHRVNSIFFTVRAQRNKVYAVAVVLIGVDCAVLFFLKAPLMLVALFVAVFLIGLVFAVVNHWWKISIHTAAVTIAVVALFVLYGQKAAIAIVLLPLVAWSRVEIEHHSPAQVIGGGILAGLIILLVYSLFGLV
jgi:membrane-associated phospholipid phosphatase